jgi:hypothetical protein
VTTPPSAAPPGPPPVNHKLTRRVLRWLSGHPGSTARQIAAGCGISSDRVVFRVLDRWAREGWCQRSRRGNGPWLWEVPEAYRAAAAAL